MSTHFASCFAPWLLWGLFLWCLPVGFPEAHWEGVLVGFAALLLLPTGLRLLAVQATPLYMLSAALFLVGYLLWPHTWAGWLALPYVLMGAFLTGQHLCRQGQGGDFSLLSWLRTFALGYWTVGAVWAMLFLLQWPPLDFGLDITALTAAHFHVAGFALTVAVRCLLAHFPLPLHRWLGIGALLGMPAVAVGIVATQLGFAPALEQLAGVAFGAFAAGVAARHGVLFFGEKSASLPVRVMWLGGALCLLAGATLAMLYAVRFSWPITAVNMPNMKVWHGTLNSVGFAYLTLLGWQGHQKGAKPG